MYVNTYMPLWYVSTCICSLIYTSRKNSHKYTFANLHLCMRVCVCIYRHRYICMYTHTHTTKHAYTHARWRVRTHTHTHKNIYTHTHVHTYKHVYAYIFAYVLNMLIDLFHTSMSTDSHSKHTHKHTCCSSCSTWAPVDGMEEEMGVLKVSIGVGKGKRSLLEKGKLSRISSMICIVNCFTSPSDVKISEQLCATCADIRALNQTRLVSYGSIEKQ